jgi:hypothetical protein
LNIEVYREYPLQPSPENPDDGVFGSYWLNWNNVGDEVRVNFDFKPEICDDPGSIYVSS